MNKMFYVVCESVHNRKKLPSAQYMLRSVYLQTERPVCGWVLDTNFMTPNFDAEKRSDAIKRGHFSYLELLVESVRCNESRLQDFWDTVFVSLFFEPIDHIQPSKGVHGCIVLLTLRQGKPHVGKKLIKFPQPTILPCPKNRGGVRSVA